MTSDDWTALSAVATAAAAGATFLTVLYNHVFWRQAARSREADLMLRLMEDYDSLREDAATLRSFFIECAASGIDAKERFANGFINPGSVTDDVSAVDESRFALSRFFVRIRKLIEAGYLSKRVVVAAVHRSAIEKVFLDLVDPLDEAKAGRNFGSKDREFYQDLLRNYEGR